MVSASREKAVEIVRKLWFRTLQIIQQILIVESTLVKIWREQKGLHTYIQGT